MAVSILHHNGLGPAADDPTKYASLTSLRLIQYSVPTYFVEPGLLHACLQTAPPQDFRFEDLKWPMNAMLFVLSNGALSSPQDGACGFIALARHKAGVNEINLPGFPATHLVEEDCFSYFTFTDHQATFAGYAPTQRNPSISEMVIGKFHDAAGVIGFSPTGEPIFGTITAAENDFIALVRAIGLRLLLLLNARPDLIRHGRELRKAAITPKKSVSSLWSPNVIGADFRASREMAANTSGERSTTSPRMHWRRGHYRLQPYGHGLSERKIIWIEPVLVAAD